MNFQTIYMFEYFIFIRAAEFPIMTQIGYKKVQETLYSDRVIFSGGKE